MRCSWKCSRWSNVVLTSFLSIFWQCSCRHFYLMCASSCVLGSVLCHLGSALLDWCILDAKQLVCFCFVISQLSVAMQEVFVLWLLECIFHRPSPTNMLIIIGANTVMTLSWCVRGVCGCCLHDKRKNSWSEWLETWHGSSPQHCQSLLILGSKGQGYGLGWV